MIVDLIKEKKAKFDYFLPAASGSNFWLGAEGINETFVWSHHFAPFDSYTRWQEDRDGQCGFVENVCRAMTFSVF